MCTPFRYEFHLKGTLKEMFMPCECFRFFNFVFFIVFFSDNSINRCFFGGQFAETYLKFLVKISEFKIFVRKFNYAVFYAPFVKTFEPYDAYMFVYLCLAAPIPNQITSILHCCMINLSISTI